MKLKEKLKNIQFKLKAKKSKFNKFGGYYHRSLEDVYEALKPLLNEFNCVLTVEDDLEVVKDVIFRKTTAFLSDVESDDVINVHMYVQECLERKGMSVEQCGGSVASYNTKYCLNKLFCIDDTEDADNGPVDDLPKKPEPMSGNDSTQKQNTKPDNATVKPQVSKVEQELTTQAPKFTRKSIEEKKSVVAEVANVKVETKEEQKPVEAGSQWD